MLYHRVFNYIEAEKMLEPGDTVVVAVSGGPDSLCLLHLLHRMAPVLKLKLVVAHLNHCLRPEAMLEEEAVRRAAEGWGHIFESRSADIKAYRSRSKICEEEAGRIERYRFLKDTAQSYKASKIALGHQLDDQAETVLFNFLRGTGIDGLAGILPKREFGPFHLIRPLLKVTRQEVEDYCAAHDLSPSTDSSNLQTVYTRNRLRLELIPHLEQAHNPQLKKTLAGLASLAATDRAYLQRKAYKLYQLASRKTENRIIINKMLLMKNHPALRGRALKIALEQMIPAGRLGRIHIEKLESICSISGKSGPIALPLGVRAYGYGRFIMLTHKQPDDQQVLAGKMLKTDGVTLAGKGIYLHTSVHKPEDLTWPPKSSRAYLDYDQLLASGSLQICSRWPGARFHPQGAPGSKKLKDFFIDQKINPYKRNTWPLVTAGEEIAWVVGIRIGHKFRVTDKTERVLVIDKQNSYSRGENRNGN